MEGVEGGNKRDFALDKVHLVSSLRDISETLKCYKEHLCSISLTLNHRVHLGSKVSFLGLEFHRIPLEKYITPCLLSSRLEPHRILNLFKFKTQIL